MFEALLVPEEVWGVNHPLYIEAQIYHGMEEAGYGYWGFSPSNNLTAATASAAWTRSAWSRRARLGPAAHIRGLWLDRPGLPAPAQHPE